MTRVVTVIGARPQFVKAAPVTRALERAGIEGFILHTGQHYDTEMSSRFFDELGLRQPDLNLEVGSGTHGVQTAAMLEGIERLLIREQPDWVLVYGDTNSTLAGALAAAKLNVPVAHVEAGLRSFNRRMPEEVNRIVTDHTSTLLFAPTDAAVANLDREGFEPSRVVRTGDVMFDAALMFRDRAIEGSTVLETLGIQSGSYVLATIHRAENTDDPVRLRTLVCALDRVAREMKVVLPLHPRTRNKLESAVTDLGAITVTDPVGFIDMVRLEMGAAVVATDSGGVQKEAFFHGVPCVTLRDETEWIELVSAGWNRVVGPTSPKAVARAILDAVGTVGEAVHPYGDGKAADLVVRSLSRRAR